MRGLLLKNPNAARSTREVGSSGVQMHCISILPDSLAAVVLSQAIHTQNALRLFSVLNRECTVHSIHSQLQQ